MALKIFTRSLVPITCFQLAKQPAIQAVYGWGSISEQLHIKKSATRKQAATLEDYAAVQQGLNCLKVMHVREIYEQASTWVTSLNGSRSHMALEWLKIEFIIIIS
jgi:hypothetical protein